MVDGERRYRAAVSLGLKEVPVVIQPTTNELDRRIEQFHIQAQHESWTHAERAMAIFEIVNQTGITMSEAFDLLNIPQGTVRAYTAFYKLINKKLYQKYDLPISWAEKLSSLKTFTKNLCNSYDVEFEHEDDKKLEEAVIEKMKKGTITKTNDFSKLKSAFSKDVKNIKEFTETSISPDALYKKSKAEGDYYLRQIVNFTNRFNVYTEKILADKSVNLKSHNKNQLLRELKTMQEQTRKFIYALE